MKVRRAYPRRGRLFMQLGTLWLAHRWAHVVRANKARRGRRFYRPWPELAGWHNQTAARIGRDLWHTWNGAPR